MAMYKENAERQAQAQELATQGMGSDNISGTYRLLVAHDTS